MRPRTNHYGKLATVFGIMFMLSLSTMSMLGMNVSAEGYEPSITMVDVNGRTISNTDSARYVYQNYTSGLTPALSEIYGTWYYSNVAVTVPTIYDSVNISSYMYATWYGPDNSILSYHAINTTRTLDIDHVDGHYYYIYGSVSWSDSPITSMNFSQGFGDYRLVLTGKVYDIGYPDHAGHYMTYYGSMTVRCVSDYVYEPTYPQADTLYAQRNDSKIYSMYDTGNSQNVSYPITAFWGTQAYNNLLVSIGSSVSTYVYYEWVKPDNSVTYAILTNTTNGYDLLTESGHSWIVKGGINYTANLTLPFDGGYGAYKLVITGKAYDSSYPASTGHYINFYHALTITYTGPDSDLTGKGPGGLEISPIVVQGMAATGGSMIVLGIMAGVWLWKHSDPIWAICTITIMPMIGFGVLQAALG